VVGESLAVGHCVAPPESVVGLVRARFPRTANFGVAGSRVLSQLGVFREYVEPLKPPVVVWFVNPGYAEPGAENSQGLLRRYLEDRHFVQRLRERQGEVDSFIRKFLIPLNLRRDQALSQDLDAADSFSVSRLMKLRKG